MGTYGKSDPVVYELQIKTDLTQKKGEIVKGKIEKIEGPNSFAACNSKWIYDQTILKRIHLKDGTHTRKKLLHPMIEDQTYANQVNKSDNIIEPHL